MEKIIKFGMHFTKLNFSVEKYKFAKRSLKQRKRFQTFFSYCNLQGTFKFANFTKFQYEKETGQLIELRLLKILFKLFFHS